MKKITLGGIKRAVRFLRESRAIYTLILIALIFNMSIIASVAWLTINRRTDVDEMGMGLAVDDTTATYEAFMYDLKTGKGTNLDSNGNPLDITNLDLNQYDTIFRAQNRYTPALARITIIMNESMKEYESGTIIITISREELDGDAGSSLTAYSSSTVRFTGFIMSDQSDLNITDPDKLYSHVCSRERFEDIEDYRGNDYRNSQTFVTVIGEGAEHTHGKHTSIQVLVDYEASDWYTDKNGDRALNVYLMITYDVQLIECFLDENQGGGISVNGTSFFFDNDMTEIKVTYTK